MAKLLRNNLSQIPQKTALTIGNFDGLHLGHQAILKQLRVVAKQQGLASAVILFEPQPSEVFQPQQCPARLTRFTEKLAQLNTQVDYVVCLKFNDRLANCSPEDFVQTILVEHLQGKVILAGMDFRFGHKRQGDLVLLEQLGTVYDFQIQIVEETLFNGQRVSSTLVRQALAEGDFPMATQLLGRHYRLQGRVVRGDQRGRLLGFPTANISLQRLHSPLAGVYAVKIFIRGQKPRLGIANVGNRPTVDGTLTLLEVHVLDYDGDLYGQRIEVEFHQQLRKEKRFADLQQLQQQIKHDEIAARAFFNS